MPFKVPATSHSLLAGIKRGENVSWTRFLATYRPFVWMLGNKYRFDMDEKEELMQNVLIDFFNAQDKFIYDSSKGPFRAYLYTVIRNRISAMARERNKRRQRINPVGGDEEIINIIKDEKLEFSQWEFDEVWKRAWEIHITTQGLEEIKLQLPPHIIQIFTQWFEQGEDPKVIAKRFEISLATFYNYKQKVYDTLKTCIQNMEEYK